MHLSCVLFGMHRRAQEKGMFESCPIQAIRQGSAPVCGECITGKCRSFEITGIESRILAHVPRLFSFKIKKVGSMKIGSICLITLMLCLGVRVVWAQTPDAQNYSQVMSVP